MSEYTDAVERNLKGMNGVSVGSCPGCEQCRDDNNPDMSMEEFASEWSSGNTSDDAGFSWSECGICGSRLGGDRYTWHWLDDNNEIRHENDCCVDCAMYLANGDEPEEWS